MLAYTVDKLTVEELQYLDSNINKNVTKLNIYTFSLKNVGLIEQTVVPNTLEGEVKYSYTPLARAIDQFAIKMDKEDVLYTYYKDNEITLNNIDEYYDYSYKTTSDAEFMTEEDGVNIFEETLEKYKKEYPNAR